MHPAIIGSVMAMARPRRPLSEAQLVRSAAAKLAKDQSARAKAARIAKHVTEAAIAYADADPFEQSLAVAQAALEPTPIQKLATCPTIDTIGLVYGRRAARFEARGFRQLNDTEWTAETHAIAKEVERVLARRYRSFLLPRFNCR